MRTLSPDVMLCSVKLVYSLHITQHTCFLPVYTHTYTVDSAAHTLGSASSHAGVRGGQTSSPHAGGKLEVQRPQHC